MYLMDGCEENRLKLHFCEVVEIKAHVCKFGSGKMASSPLNCDVVEIKAHVCKFGSGKMASSPLNCDVVEIKAHVCKFGSGKMASSPLNCDVVEIKAHVRNLGSGKMASSPLNCDVVEIKPHVCKFGSGKMASSPLNCDVVEIKPHVCKFGSGKMASSPLNCDVVEIKPHVCNSDNNDSGLEITSPELAHQIAIEVHLTGILKRQATYYKRCLDLQKYSQIHWGKIWMVGRIDEEFQHQANCDFKEVLPKLSVERSLINQICRNYRGDRNVFVNAPGQEVCLPGSGFFRVESRFARVDFNCASQQETWKE
ncbi:hypothetical protein MAR_007021 [Mya arenaria]|uniref:Uncharacterized protein n=1 Tax=Mya arenaria TaxID=6604 RepID=A0ABY7DHR9_MYAAR|nr:hypothetical protein MAR_007021 [Mya arenaria]